MNKIKDEDIKHIKDTGFSRNKFFKDRISNRIFYKIDAGIEKIDSYIISFLAFIYTLSGFTSIDIPAYPEIITDTKKAISKAILKADEIGLDLEANPLLMASTKSSLFCEDNEGLFKSQLNSLLDSGIESIELHIDTIDLNLIKKQINIIKSYFPNKIISISLHRKNLSNANMIELIKSAHNIINRELIVEVNECNDNSCYESIHRLLQTISTADIINKQLKLKEAKLNKLPIILAAGNNSFTSNLADQCGVPFNGITFEPDIRETAKLYGRNYFDLSDELIIKFIEPLIGMTKTTNIFR
tara:strand:- start:7026 stop:7925 length:900 start_codon:yes stop_codon:yes gene_type:complete